MQIAAKRGIFISRFHYRHIIRKKATVILEYCDGITYNYLKYSVIKDGLLKLKLP